MNKQIYIHAGAHRTGTSSFQLCLHENREVLDHHGFDIGYPARDGVPDGTLRLQFPRPRHGEKRIPMFAAGVRAIFDELSPAENRDLILSEENIPGPMRHFYEGRFFPAAAKRFSTLAAACTGRPVHLIYVVRSYADLYVSAYRKRAEDNPVPPFSELRPQFMAMDRGWPELIAEMRDCLQPESLIVLPYEKRGESRSLLQQLVPKLQNADLKEPETTMNLSATDAALETLQTRYRAGETLKRRQWQRIVRNNADKTGVNGFAVFPDAEKQELEARYRTDLARLAALPGLSFKSLSHSV